MIQLQIVFLRITVCTLLNLGASLQAMWVPGDLLKLKPYAGNKFRLIFMEVYGALEVLEGYQV